MSLSSLAPGNLVSRDGLGHPSRVSLLILHLSRLNLVLTHGIPPTFRDRVHLYIPSIAITGEVPSFSGHALANRWPSPLRVHRRRSRSPQGSSSNGCGLFRCHHGPITALLSYPTLNIGIVDIYDTLVSRSQAGLTYYEVRVIPYSACDMENERSDPGRDGRTRLARFTSQAQTGTGKSGRIDNPCPVDVQSVMLKLLQ